MHLFSPVSFLGLGTIGTVWLAVDWIIRIMALFYVPRNRKPTAGTAWLLLIFFFPIFGLLVFLAIGSPKLPKSRRTAQETLDSFIHATLRYFKQNLDEKNLLSAHVPKKYLPVATLSESLSHLPAFRGNDIRLLSDYDGVLKSMVADIDAAQYYVHLEYFIIILDDTTQPIFDALARAVQRGVTVRVLYDSFSTKRYSGWRQTMRRLRQDGVVTVAILPFRLPGYGYVRPDLRNHRKLLVVDGSIGYTGSLNIIGRDYHRKDDIYYDELVVRAHGPIVLQLAAVFLTDWHSETGVILDYNDLSTKALNIVSRGKSLAQVLPSGPGYEDENNLKLFTCLMYAAQTKITIVNPYFVPDEALMTALTTAARRGVEVVMINSESMDQWMVGHAQRSFYEELLKAGVKIYLYKSPILLHSKFITVDGETATIGSSNLDIRSFMLNLEVTLISYDAATVAQLDSLTASYLQRSRRVDLASWHKRPVRQKLLDNMARLTAALQ